MSARMCPKCRENVADDQVECPFCDAPTVLHSDCGYKGEPTVFVVQAPLPDADPAYDEPLPARWALDEAARISGYPEWFAVPCLFRSAENRRVLVNARVIERRAVIAKATPFPQPQRRDGKDPCGECRLPVGETCDICGASA